MEINNTNKWVNITEQFCLQREQIIKHYEQIINMHTNNSTERKINYGAKNIIIYICTYAKQIVYQINIYTEHESLFNANKMFQYRNSPN